jgi:hypothetical protein
MNSRKLFWTAGPGAARNGCSWIAIFIGSTIVAGTPAQACTIRGPSDGAEIGAADAVVIGRIANYRIVSGKTPDLDQLGQYAVFDVYVDRVLAGSTAKKLTVKWDRRDYLDHKRCCQGATS